MNWPRSIRLSLAWVINGAGRCGQVTDRTVANQPSGCVSWGGVEQVELGPEEEWVSANAAAEHGPLHTHVNTYKHIHKSRRAAIGYFLNWMNEGHMRGCNQYSHVILWTVSLLLLMYNSSMAASSPCITAISSPLLSSSHLFQFPLLSKRQNKIFPFNLYIHTQPEGRRKAMLKWVPLQNLPILKSEGT